MTGATAPTLGQRMLMVTLIPTALLALTMTSLFMLWSMQSADLAMRDRAITMASFMAPAAEYGVLAGNRTTLEGLIKAALEQPEVVAVAFHDSDGRILAESGHAVLTNLERIVTSSRATILDTHSGRLSVATPIWVTRLVIDDIVPDRSDTDTAIAHDDQVIGWIYIEFDTRALLIEKRRIVLTALATIAAGLGLSGVLAFRLAHAVAEPLARLAMAVGQLSSGERGVSVPDSASTGELRALERGFNAMAQSITEAHQTLQARVDEATARLAHQASHDPLTGLPNRRAFEQALEEVHAGSRRAKDGGVLCFIDLDRFKIVNDSCGHAAGDQLLREIAQIVRQRLRADDLICRIGGDEFALILHACSIREATRIAETLREAISSHPFNWKGQDFRVGASIGLAPIDGSLDGPADVTVAADLACYKAKKSGRDQVVVHGEEVDQP